MVNTALCPRLCSRRESGFCTPACLLATQVWSYQIRTVLPPLREVAGELSNCLAGGVIDMKAMA
jgi:hypothetical protein